MGLTFNPFTTETLHSHTQEYMLNYHNYSYSKLIAFNIFDFIVKYRIQTV